MLYVIPWYLIYRITGNLCVFTVFLQFPSPHSLPLIITVCHLFFYEFGLCVCFRSTLLVPSAWLVVIIFLYVSKWAPEISLVTIFTIKIYYIIIDYIPHTLHFILLILSFCNGKFVLVHHLSLSSTHPPYGNKLDWIGVHSNGLILIQSLFVKGLIYK